MLTGAVLKIVNEARDVTHDVKKLGLYSSNFYQIDILVDDNQETLFEKQKTIVKQIIKPDVVTPKN